MPTSGLRGTCFTAFATMRLIEIAAMLGDTVPVVERHYRKLVSLRMAERLAKIPTRSWSATVMNELLTVREVAAVRQCSEDVVVRRFSKLPGVTRTGPPETVPSGATGYCGFGKRFWKSTSVRERIIRYGVTVPQRPERRRKSDGWETRRF